MNRDSRQLEELYSLFDDLCDARLSESDAARLDRLLRDDPDARREYFCYLDLHAGLGLIEAGKDGVHEVMSDESPCEACGVVDLQAASPTGHSEFIIHHPAFASSFVGSVAFSYMIAVLLVSAGLAIAWAWKLPDLTQVATSPSPTHTEKGQPTPGMTFVGRITGLVNCEWADPETAVVGPVAVPLGRKYALASGLLEITYDTGAKVLLQGPCTYEVDAAAGGYLSVGKLTARVESRESRVEINNSIAKSRAADRSRFSSFNSQLSALDSGLFAVRTPTATVTDLGTEFGVVVDKDGTTESYVFQGAVEVQVRAGDDAAAHKIRLGQNESVRIEKRPNDVEPKIAHATVDPTTFLRPAQVHELAKELSEKPLRRWQAYSKRLREDPALVAYYPFEKQSGEDARTLCNVSAAGSALDGHIDGADWGQGRLEGKRALLFRGPGSAVTVAAKEPFDFSGSFSVAVWFKVNRFVGQWQVLVAKGDNSWRLQQDHGRPTLTFDTNNPETSHVVPGTTRLTEGRWHLAAAVQEVAGNTAHKRLYVDGRLDAVGELECPLRHNDEPVVLGGNTMKPERGLYGSIDEVVILSRAMSAEEVSSMFEAGSPDTARAEKADSQR